jgi:hypothetical protein
VGTRFINLVDQSGVSAQIEELAAIGIFRRHGPRDDDPWVVVGHRNRPIRFH